MRKSIFPRIGIATLVVAAFTGHVAAQTDGQAGNPAATKVRDIAKAATKSKDQLAPAPKVRVVAGPVEAVRVYRLPIGPWSWDITVPESVDLPDIADRIRGFFGMLAILGVAAFLSDNRQAISRRVVLWGLALQWGFAILVLRVPAGIQFLKDAGEVVKSILDCAIEGAGFVFGRALVKPDGPVGFVFAFRVLPTVIFVAALFAVLYHLGVMQWIVRGFAVVMAWFMGTSGAESLNVAASLFLGQTEAPLTIRPYLPRLTRSELLTVMTSGMAHVSGGVMAAYIAFDIEARHILTAVIMTAPGAIMMSKMLVPETEKPETLGNVSSAEKSTDANLLDAASRGTRDGLHLALNIAAMLVSFLALVALVNMGLSYVGTSLQAIVGGIAGWANGPGPVPQFHWGDGWSLQGIVGWAMAPVAYLLGVPWENCKDIGKLLGTRTVLNELIAFKDLGELKAQEILFDRSVVIASFALCGFANISSIGIQLGGIGALAPERRHDLARLGVRALLAGTLANYLSACIAGILL
jgi:concentrative nucleoside transporter, CNT family